MYMRAANKQMPFVRYIKSLLNTILFNHIVQSIVPLGEKAAHFLNLYKEGLSKTKFDTSEGVKKEVLMDIICIVLFFIISFVIFFMPSSTFSAENTNILQDMVKATKIACLRPFTENPTNTGQETVIDTFMILFIIYTILTYKLCIIFYICICKSLRNAFTQWNKTAKGYLESRPRFGDYKSTSFPYSFDHLVHSHFILVNLVNLTDDIFGPIVITYFATQIIVICFEIYNLIAMGLSSGLMAACAFFILLQTSALFLKVSLTASSVHESAMEAGMLKETLLFSDWSKI